MTDEELAWLHTEFARCKSWIQDALDHDEAGGFELKDVWDYIVNGRAQLWPLPNSAIVTVLEYFPRKIVLYYWLCGGELKECTGETHNIERWAKDAGASMTRIVGRPGWVRALSGYKKSKAVLMTKAI